MRFASFLLLIFFCTLLRSDIAEELVTEIVCAFSPLPFLLKYFQYKYTKHFINAWSPMNRHGAKTPCVSSLQEISRDVEITKKNLMSFIRLRKQGITYCNDGVSRTRFFKYPISARYTRYPRSCRSRMTPL